MRIWGGDSPRPPPFTYHGGSDPLSRTFRGRPLLGQIFLSWLRHQRHFPWRCQAGQAFPYSTERDRGLQRGARHLRVRPAAALRAGHGGEAGPAGVPGRLGRGRGAGTAGGASPGCKKKKPTAAVCLSAALELSQPKQGLPSRFFFFGAGCRIHNHLVMTCFWPRPPTPQGVNTRVTGHRHICGQFFLDSRLTRYPPPPGRGCSGLTWFSTKE